MALDGLGSYALYAPLKGMPLEDLTRPEALAEYEKRMAEKGARKQLLTGISSANGYAIGPDDDGLDALTDFFRENVSGDSGTWQLDPLWLSISIDVGLYIGDALILRRPALHWELENQSKRAINYHWPVVVGFGGPKRVASEFSQRTARYGVAHLRNPTASAKSFRDWVQSGVEVFDALEQGRMPQL